MPRNSEERFPGSVSSSFTKHKCPKKRFSVLERRFLPKVGERERTPFVFCPNPHHVKNPRLGTSFETIWDRFDANQRGFLSCFEVKSDLKSGNGEKWRIALYLRHMVVVVKSARILRLSSKLWEVASSRKRRISAETGPGRLRERAK